MICPENRMDMKPKCRDTEFRHKRIENGLCPNCGREMDRKGWYCSKCLEKEKTYRKETREWYKENHLCSICGKERVCGTDKICFECRAKRNETRKPLTENTKAKMRVREHSQYAERKAAGICTRCGKRPAYDGKTKCYTCLQKDAQAHQAKYERSERPSYGECYFCGKETYKNFRVCKECHDRIKKSSEGNGGKNQAWKMQNELIFGNHEGQK